MTSFMNDHQNQTVLWDIHKWRQKGLDYFSSTCEILMDDQLIECSTSKMLYCFLFFLDVSWKYFSENILVWKMIVFFLQCASMGLISPINRGNIKRHRVVMLLIGLTKSFISNLIRKILWWLPFYNTFRPKGLETFFV